MERKAHAYRCELRRPVSSVSFEIFQISLDGNRVQSSIIYVVFKAANIAFFMVLSIGYCVIITHRPSLRLPSRTKTPFLCKSAKSRCIVRVTIPVFCDISLALNVGFSCISFNITV